MKEEVPKSARDNWQLWKLSETLTLEEISVLISKRRQDLKYERDSKKINQLKTDISILTDAYGILKKRGK
jgi:hypothetical protein